MLWNRRSSNRRGVILLISLALLVLFLLIGMMLVLTAARFRKTAQQFATADLGQTAPAKFLDDALMQVVRDSPTRRSHLFGQSLLEDFYGNDHKIDEVRATVTAVATVGTEMQFTLNESAPYAFDPNDGYYVGRVLVVRTAVGPSSLVGKCAIITSSTGAGKMVTVAAAPFTGLLPNSTVAIMGPPVQIRGIVRANPPPGTTGLAARSELLAGGQVIQWFLTADDKNALSPIPGFYNGCVVTLLDGPASGRSTRVLDYFFVGAQQLPVLQVLAFGGDFRQSLTTYLDSSNTSLSQLPAARILINGRPFSGTGNGFNPAAGLPGFDPAMGIVDAKLVFRPNSIDQLQWHQALLPNLAYFEPQAATTSAPLLPAYPFPGGAGGQNEDYDAPDYQNPYLSFTHVNFNGLRPTDVLPSYHRPALLKYWQKQWETYQKTTPAGILATAEEHQRMGWRMPPELWRKIMFRPVGKMSVRVRNPSSNLLEVINITDVDHPNFTGSNASPDGFDPLNERYDGTGGFPDRHWDVDNDGDGVTDSVWVDLGFAPQMTRDGRLYKPLFAILIQDLDGRINVNSAGTQGYITQTDVVANDPLPVPSSPGGPLAGSTPTLPPVKLPRGLGTGPAEIDLMRALRYFGSSFSHANVKALTTELMSGKLVTIAGSPQQLGLLGRYVGQGETVQAGAGPGKPSEPLTAAIISKLFDYPEDFSNATQPSTYGSPPDIEGVGAVAIDHRGQPLFINMARPKVNVISGGDGGNSTAYKLDLSRAGTSTATPSDAPFMVSELEPILRQYDTDAAALPPRLRILLSSFLSSNRVVQTRQWLTTDSFHVPAVSPMPPLGSLSTETKKRLAKPSGHVAHLLAARLRAAGVPEATVPDEINRMLPRELFAGLPLDINRPVGNAKDDNANGVIDEPEEVSNAAPTDQADWVDLINDDPLFKALALPASSPRLARQILARHLYVLLMLLKSPTDIDFDGDNITSPEETARGLAQWAINAVDFRDPDSIMSPFEYDENPFNGWQANIDGDPVTLDPPLSGLPNERRLVWGCERPELLLTEAIAWHDRRTEDTQDELVNPRKVTGPQPQGSLTTMPNTNTPPDGPDEDFDQRLRPRSTVFIELYNPWTSTYQQSVRPFDMYSTSALPIKTPPRPTPIPAQAASGVVLNKKNDAGSPVWRIAVVKGNTVTPHNTDDPDKEGTLPIERTIYFRRPPDSIVASGQQGQIYVRDFPDPIDTNEQTEMAPIKPGRYAVIGSAGKTEVTTIGPNTITRYVSTIGTKPGATLDQTRRIELIPNLSPDVHQVMIRNNRTDKFDEYTTNTQTIRTQESYVARDPTVPTAELSTPLDIQPVVAGVINSAIKIDSMGAITLEPRSASISEPADGYPTQVIVTSTDVPPTVTDSSVWNASAAGGEGAYEPPVDVPLDQDRTETWITKEPDGSTPSRTIRFDDTGTATAYRMLHLQRLADPTQAWNATGNPYLTIDSLAVDLTVFNGQSEPGNPVDPKDESQEMGKSPKILFNSIERGTKNETNPNILNNFWRHEPPAAAIIASTVTDVEVSGDTHHFAYELKHTLGYRNRVSTAVYDHNDAPQPLPADAPSYIGAQKFSASNPIEAMPWLTWNNRPYVSPHELLLVPFSRSSRLLRDFSLPPPNFTGASPGVLATHDRYKQPTGTEPNVPFGHLLNFFESGPDPTHRRDKDFYRLFEYVGVAPKFAGTETLLPAAATPTPQLFSAATPSPINPEDFGVRFLHYPFNKVPRYREPGKININTVNSFDVWAAVINGYPLPGIDDARVSYDALLKSRRGYGPPATTGHPLALSADPLGVPDGKYPTNFAGVFRSFGGADLVPKIFSPVVLTGEALSSYQGLPINATLLRQDTSSDPPQPLFGPKLTEAYRDTSRNPYFAYQGITRLSNSVTTRSNVFAVWITVGYFELETHLATDGITPRIDAGHPDGFRLGAEVGYDSGSHVRNRAFYIIDRSIPVGYERGQDHNVDKTILLRRYIE